ncbi:ArnT family glycosyltransferase [Leptolyngbya sp. AN02str]|uniref:ArnT family glycosyltransferase n=1 Tax=Leptolyngbya sp. AN02str TaxID=3423363 RepID=UPI003D313648
MTTLQNSFIKTSKKQQRLLVGILCLFFVMLSLASLLLPLKESLTYDEDYYYASGEAILSGQPSKRGETDIGERNIMPSNALNPLISRSITAFKPGPMKRSRAIFIGKLATILISVLLAIYVFIWSRQLYGVGSGFLALALYILDPNIIAHSRIVHQDIYGAFGIFVATYYFWQLLKFGGYKNTVLSIVSFGIAQISRFTSIYLIPIYLILAIGFYHSAILKALKLGNFKVVWLGIKRACIYICLLVLTTVLIINLGFSFDKTFTKFGDYKFESQSLSSLQAKSAVLRAMPVPVPYAYLRGLDMGKQKQEQAFGNTPAYLMGKLGLEDGKKRGFKEYFIVAFLYKVPIATQIILLMAVVSLFRFRRQICFWQNEAFLIVPSLFCVTTLSFSNAQIGIRYILMIFPFLFVLSSRAALSWDILKARYRLFVIGLVAYLLVSNLSYFPHYLSYFNELLVDRRMGYTILGDSNIDWGQNQAYLQKYLEKNTSAFYLRYEYVNGAIVNGVIRGEERLKITNAQGQEIAAQDLQSGLLIVSVNQLLGITINPTYFEWLRELKKPIDHVAYSYLVFEMEPQDIHHLLKTKDI